MQGRPTLAVRVAGDPAPEGVQRRLAAMIYYVGQNPLRGGLATLAVILWRVDWESFLTLGAPIVGARYVRARRPGAGPARGLLTAVVDGVRWGSVEHRLHRGELRAIDAVWVAKMWRNGVPL